MANGTANLPKDLNRICPICHEKRGVYHNTRPIKHGDTGQAFKGNDDGIYLLYEGWYCLSCIEKYTIKVVLNMVPYEGEEK